MEGKFASDGLQALDGDDDMLTAMARELAQNRGIGESADLLWKRVGEFLPSAGVACEAEQSPETEVKDLFSSDAMAEIIPNLPSIDSNSTSSPALQLSLFEAAVLQERPQRPSIPVKFHQLSLADVGKSTPSPRSRWCSYCKRNEHHLCSGFRRVNHGLVVRCECPHRERHDRNPAAGAEPAAFYCSSLSA
jgi:hypothetical protein